MSRKEYFPPVPMQTPQPDAPRAPRGPDPGRFGKNPGGPTPAPAAPNWNGAPPVTIDPKMSEPFKRRPYPIGR